MRRALVLMVLAGLAAAAAAGTGTGAAAACKPGIHTVGKTTYHVFCGPASASVTMAGKTYSFRNGSCLKVGITKVFTMSIGTLSIGKGKPKYSYLGVTIPAASSDGLYQRAIVTWAFGGKRYSLYNVKLHLTNKQTRGTFAGRIVGKRGKVTGSFRCR
jgi:hypothetical protein